MLEAALVDKKYWGSVWKLMKFVNDFLHKPYSAAEQLFLVEKCMKKNLEKIVISDIKMDFFQAVPPVSTKGF